MERLQSSQRLHSADNPYEEQLVKAAADLSKTLASSDGLSDHDRGVMAGQKLGHFLTASKRRIVEDASPEHSPPQPPPTQGTEDLDPLTGIPKTYAYHAKSVNLLEFWKRDPLLKWDDKHRVYVDGNLIPHSNLTDLLLHAVRHRKSSDPPPPGMFQLRERSIDENLPTSLFVNPTWRRVDESNKTRDVSVDRGRPMKRLVTPASVKRPRNISTSTPRDRSRLLRWQVPR